MRRSPRYLLAWCAALVVAALTAAVVGSDLASLHRRARSLGPPRKVVVATHDVPLGAAVRPGDVEVVARYASAIPRGAVTQMREVIGRVAIVPILTGGVVVSRQLAPAERPGLTGLVPVGRRAVRVTAADGLRPPTGAVVDVIAALDPATGAGDSGGAVTVVRAALVLAVDDSGSTDEYTPSGGAGVTLLVTEEEARGLAYAAANGVLTLALAPPEAACCRSSEP
jgi:pilus assembly protein CpaB